MPIDTKNNKLYIGNQNKLEEWNKHELKIKALLKNYLELDNISFLFGAGSSINLGSTSIGYIPKVIEDSIKSRKKKDGSDDELYEEFIKIVKNLQNVANVKRIKVGEQELIDFELEKLLDYLAALSFVKSRDKSSVSYKLIDEIILIIKREIFKLCDLDTLKIKEDLPDDISKNLNENRYHFHEVFIKKILQRSLNLKRANIFTTNYDLAFEHAFDNLGVKYIDGFSGFNNRAFKPETFDHDIFYPGSTTEGRVHRIEKVIRYFKLHGSLTWKYENPSITNIYGIKEYQIDYIRELIKDDESVPGDLMIYPTAAKKSYTLDYPFSEIFRQFVNTIIQPQSALITYGYSFRDDHINDIIYQALTAPTFTLIIIDLNGTNKNLEIERLKNLNDPRIIILQGSQLGDFPYFVQYALPDLIEIENEQRLINTIKKLKIDKEQNEEIGDNEAPETHETQPN